MNFNPIHYNYFYPTEALAEIIAPSLLPKNPLLTSETRHGTYQDLIANLNDQQKTDLESKIDCLEPGEMSLSKVVQAINDSQLSDASIWQHEQFPLWALKAFREEHIDSMDFTTSQLFYNVMNHGDNKSHFKEIPLFVDDAPNDEAWKLIEQTVLPFTTQYHQEEVPSDFFPIPLVPFMTTEQQNIFFTLMRKLQPLQRRFLLVPEPNPIDLSRGQKLRKTYQGTVTELIQVKYPCFNVFSRVSDERFGQPLRMIPSLGMLQAYLFATGGNCTLISQFGLASLDYLKQGISCNERSFCLNFAFLPKVEQADNLGCLQQTNDVEYHDFYHIDIMNLVRIDMPKFAGMAQLLQTLSASASHSLAPVIQLFYQLILDMEHVEYRVFYSQRIEPYSQPLTEGVLFWATIDYDLRKLELLIESKFKNESEKYIKKLIKLIVQELVLRENSYQIVYGLNLNLLEI